MQPIPDMYSTVEFSHSGQREENQDRYCVLANPETNELLVIVADGMGGHEGGALAADATIEAATTIWSQKVRYEDPESFLKRLIVSCHDAVVEKGKQHNISPRSTIVALYFFPKDNTNSGEMNVMSIHAGDSRVIQFSDKQFVKQTIDHSLSQLAVLKGEISLQEIGNHPDQNKLITNLGGDIDPEPEITNWEITEGDRFVVCSDGFWELFGRDELQNLIEKYAGIGAQQPKVDSNAPETAKEYPLQKSQYSQTHLFRQKLESIFLAKLKGYSKHDNTTAVIIRVHIEKAGKSLLATTKSTRLRWPAIFGMVMVIAVAMTFLILNRNARLESSISESDLDDRITDQENGSASGSTTTEPLASNSTSNAGKKDDPVSTIGLAGQSEEKSKSDADTSQQSQLSSIRQEVIIPVEDNEDLTDQVSDLLRSDSSIGVEDGLVVSSEGTMADRRIIRIQQTHKGIPVFGAVVVAIEEDGNVIRLTGETGADISIETIPKVTYEEAIVIANQNTAELIESEDNANLIVFDHENLYYLAWIGIATFDGMEGRIVLSAMDGSILDRLQIRLDTNQ